MHHLLYYSENLLLSLEVLVWVITYRIYRDESKKGFMCS